MAHRIYLGKAGIDFLASQTFSGFSPLIDVWQDFRTIFRRHFRDVGPGTCAPEAIKPIDHGAIEKWSNRLNNRASIREQLRCSFHRRACFIARRLAKTGIEPKADFETFYIDIKVHPVDILIWQAHRVTAIRTGKHRHIKRAVGNRTRHRTSNATKKRRIDWDTPEGRLQANQTAPAGRQADGATNIRTDMQWPVTSSTSAACTST